MLVQTVILTALVAFGNANPVSTSYDTIIVGMGASGCAAAAELSRAGKRVLALEAMDRIGGRVHTVPFGGGIVEVGAEWIHGSNNSRTYELATEHNITIIPQNITTAAYRSDGSRTDAALLDELTGYAIGIMDEVPEETEPLGQFLTKKIKEYITAHHPDLLKDQEYIDQFLKYMDLIVDTYEASDSWMDVSTRTNFKPLEGNQGLSWHRLGYKTLFDILLNKYNGGPGFQNLEIKLQKVVTMISYNPQNPDEDVTVTCEDGSVYKAKNVIVTVSIGVLKATHQTLFSPSLPSTKVAAINSISFGVVGKILLNFDEIWWDPNVEFDAFLWKEEDRKQVSHEDRWLLTVDGVARTMGCNTTISVWTIGAGTRQVEALPDDVVQTKVMQLIRKFMGKERKIPDPVGMIKSKWYSNPYIRGTYTYDNVESPKHVSARADLAAPLLDSIGAPRVLFAGEASELVHFSTVHGAIETGEREANRLLNRGH